MNRNKFDESITALLYFKNVPVSETHTSFLFNMMKDDFTDDEFQEMCMDICKSEELYNKYPDPKLFYDRKKTAKETILIEEGSFYLDDTMPQYRAVIDDLDQDTRDRVCNNVAQWLLNNKRGELVSEQFVIERLKQFRPIPIDYEEPMTLTEIKKLIADNKGDK